MPKIIDYTTTPEGKILAQALALVPGDALYQQTSGRTEARALSKALQHCSLKLGFQAKFFIYPELKDSRWWVVIKLHKEETLYKKDSQGQVSRVALSDPNLRIATLMIRDGLTLDEINSSLSPGFITESQYQHLKRS